MQQSPTVALIIGITGQDGSYLSELLLQKHYIVHGVVRRSSSLNTSRIDHLYTDPHARETRDKKENKDRRFHLHYGDLNDATNLCHLMSTIRPNEVYNLGAQSHVQVSFELAEYTSNVDALGTLRLLEAIRSSGLTRQVRFYQASTSELYGKAQEIPQSETTPFYPRSPYAIAKQFAYWITINYREAYQLFACNGILFNHESPRRGPTFVTRKTTQAVARIHLGLQDCLWVGNLHAIRDWGHARDYVRAMWLMLQNKEPVDYVVATGEKHTVKEFVESAFAVVGLHIQWSGQGVDETGVDQDGKVRVQIDPKYFRLTEVNVLVGDASKIRQDLDWKPSMTFAELVKEMVEADIAHLKHGKGEQHQ